MHVVAQPPWNPGYPVLPLLAGAECFVGEWRCAGARPQWRSELARYVELDLPKAGAHLRRFGRERRVCHPAVGVLSGAGDSYEIAAHDPQPRRSTVVLLRGALADELYRRPRTHVAPLSGAAARLHFALLGAAEPVAREELALSLVRQVVSDAGGRAAAPPTCPASSRRLAEEVQHVLATRFAERLTLATIAAACKSSPFHLSRIFRACAGVTIHRQLTQVRLRAALSALAEHRGRLAELAFATGFSSHSHFTSAFRAELGCAPSELLERQRPRVFALAKAALRERRAPTRRRF